MIGQLLPEGGVRALVDASNGHWLSQYEQRAHDLRALAAGAHPVRWRGTAWPRMTLRVAGTASARWAWKRKAHGGGMLVRQVMSSEAQACTSQQTLGEAARIMWELDVGCVPVVNDEGQPIAMLTDRDIAMAAYTTGKPLTELHVWSAMSSGVFSCKESDTLAAAEQTMRCWQVRRVPVVDDTGCLVGIVSINDVVLARGRTQAERVKERVLGDVTETLTAICRHRMNA